jgi:hypothetical protein
MTPAELKKECTVEKWLPILIIRTAGDDTPIIPLFDRMDLASRFVERNLPPKWICGVLNLQPSDAELIDSKGWKAIKYDYPRKIKDVVKFDVEIIDLNHDVTIKV